MDRQRMNYTQGLLWIQMEVLEMVEACLRGDRISQKKLFDLFAGRMLAVCMRYSKHRMEAEDLLQDGFIRVFMNLDQFKNDGPLIINGTGQKGRITAKYLLEWKIPFFWISHEATKFPNGIFNHPLLWIDEIPIAEKAQVLNTTLLSEKSLVEIYSKHIATLYFYQL